MRRFIPVAICSLGVLLGIGMATVSASSPGTRPPSHRADKVHVEPDFGTCAELTEAYDPRTPYDLVYDPANDSLQVFGDVSQYELVQDDSACVVESPEVRALVTDALATHVENVANDCDFMRHLSTLPPSDGFVKFRDESWRVDGVRSFIEESCKEAPTSQLLPSGQ